MENKFNIENLELYYGNFKALKNINMGIKEKEDYRFHRPVRLWKKYPSQILKTE